jgi:hypothetical protein
VKSKLITAAAANPRRTFVVILDSGDEFMRCMRRFAREEELTASQFTAIGAFSSAVLGYFEWDRKDYHRIRIEEQVEVVSLLGDIAVTKGESTLHAHVTLAKRDGSAWGGHLMEGIARPTLEIIVSEAPASLVRSHDPDTGLALINLD